MKSGSSRAVREMIAADNQAFLEELETGAKTFLDLSPRELARRAFDAGAKSALAAVAESDAGVSLELFSGEEAQTLAPARPQSPVERVFQAHLVARSAYYRKKNGFPPSHTPRLTAELRKIISYAVRRHGEEAARAAGIGIFLSPFHIGRDPNANGKEYLSPDLVWKVTTATGRDNVERFAALYHERRDAIDNTLAAEQDRRQNLLERAKETEQTEQEWS